MSINYDLDSENPDHIALAQLIVDKQILATGKEYEAAVRLCAAQIEITATGIQIKFPPVATSQDILSWWREMESHDLDVSQVGERLLRVSIPSYVDFMDVAEHFACRLAAIYQVRAVVKTPPSSLKRVK